MNVRLLACLLPAALLLGSGLGTLPVCAQVDPVGKEPAIDLQGAADGWVPLAEAGRAPVLREVTMEHEPDVVRVKVALPGFSHTARKESGATYRELAIPGWYTALEPGRPAVPMKTILLEMPRGVVPVVRITNLVERRIKGLSVWPAQPPLPDVSPQPPAPPFQRDTAYYAEDVYHQKTPVRSQEIAGLRNRRLLAIELAPIRVNSARQEATVAESFDLVVAYEKLPEPTEVEPGLRAPDSRNEILPAGFEDGTPLTYMVMMDDQFTNNTLLATFLDWKRRKGCAVTVVKTSEIAPSGAPTNGQLTAYLRALPAADYPEYLLIVGDHTAANGVEGAYFNSDEADYYGYTDLDFARRTTADYLPDLYYGRLPATNSPNLSNLLSRVLLMDRTPPTNTYYQKVCVAGQIQDGDDNNNVADRLFCETADAIACFFEQDAGGVDYTCTRALVNPDSVASTCRWNSSSIVWNSTDSIGARVWDHFVSDTVAQNRISSNVNQGIVILQHRDHGYVTGSGWADPPYQTTQVNALTNGNNRPVVFSINCNSGMYHLPSNFTRAWMQHPNGGAYAVFAPVDTSYSWYNDWLTHGFYTAFLTNYLDWHNASTAPDWPKNLTAPGGAYGAAGSAQRLGEMLNFAKMYMRERYGAHETTFRLFHLFGDPESYMHLLQPATQSVSFPASVDYSAGSVSVTTGVANAQVCLYSETMQVQAVALTAGALGTATLAISPITTGTLSVTVTRWGARPYEGSLSVTGQPPPLVQYHSHTVLESGDGDGALEPGETGLVSVVLKNLGPDSAVGVEATLTNLSAHVSVLTDRTRAYGVLASGALTTNATPFAVAVDSVCPAGAQSLRLTIRSEDGGWTNTFDLSVQRIPGLYASPSSWSLSAPPGGSDSASLVVSNTGSGDLTFNLSDSLAAGATNYLMDTSRQAGGPAFGWIDISSLGSAVTLADDGESALLPIGFSLPFYGQMVTQFMIGANGVVAFDSGGVGFDNAALPSAGLPERSCAVFWDDMNPEEGGTIRYANVSGQMVVSWLAVPRYDATAHLTFQAILQPSGTILFQYLAMSGTAASATIGLQASSAGPAAQAAYNTAFASNGLAVRFQNSAESWLSLGSSGGTLAPGTSTSVLLTADAADLSSGLYTATVWLAHNDPGQSTRTLPVTFTVADALPEPWRHADIGSVGLAGSATYTSGVFTVAGSGADIESWTEEFHYVYRPASGNVELVARVVTQGYTHAWAKAGLMMRTATNTGSRYAMLVTTPDGHWQFMARSADGGALAQNNNTGVTFPHWLKLARSDQTISTFSSPDGATWTLRGRQIYTNLPDTLVAGLPVCSHNDAALGTVVFDQVRLAATDSDHDGLPDWWETACFGNPTNASPTADDDDDGQSNYCEWQAGCDPTNAASFFHTRGQQNAVGAGFVIRWPSATGRTYAVGFTTNLLSSFTPFASNLPATPAENALTDTLHGAAGHLYYRVILEDDGAED